MEKKRAALALGSGGARGLAQIGMIHELEKANFEIVAISGTSIGSLIGGLYASGHLGEFEKWIKNLDKSGVLELVDFTLNAQGFVKGERVFNEMRKFIPSVQIEDLSIPFTAVSADLHSRKEVRISEGELFDAIRASIAIPSVLTPVINGDQLLVDGGVVNPLPISAIPASDAEFLIAADLNGSDPYQKPEKEKSQRQQERKRWNTRISEEFNLKFKDFFFKENKKTNKPNYFEIINSSFDLMQDSLTEVVLKDCKPDILVRIPRDSASTFSFYKAEELIEYGRKAMAHELELKDLNK